MKPFYYNSSVNTPPLPPPQPSSSLRSSQFSDNRHFVTSNYLNNLDVAFTPNNNWYSRVQSIRNASRQFGLLYVYASGDTNCFSCSVTVTIQLCKSDVRPTMEHMHPQFGTAFNMGRRMLCPIKILVHHGYIFN